MDRCVGVILRLACAAAAYFNGIDSDRNGPRSVDKTCGDKSDFFLCPSRQAKCKCRREISIPEILFSQLGCDLDPLGSIPDVT